MRGSPVFGTYRVLIVGGKEAYFEGISGIKSYNPVCIEFFVKRKTVKITGAALNIEKLGGGDLVVRGNIAAVAENEDAN